MTHQMILIAEAGDGTQAWECPQCGRRLILRFPPNYLRMVVARGDETVAHAGGAGGLTVGVGVVGTATPTDRAWLAEVGIDWTT